MTHTPAHSHQSHQSHHDRPGHGPAPEHDTGLAELLDLDAVLGAPVLAVALDAASDALDTEPRTIVDLGAGTGTGSLALAARFPDARIHSLDASSAMLDRLRTAAAAAGVVDRVEPHLINLDGDWPAVLPASIDLAWAALSLHHLTSPEHFLPQVMGALRPGGVLVVIEFTGTTTFDPDDLGTGNGELGERLVAALAARGYPVTAEWTSELSGAGFSPVQRLDTALSASALTAEGAHYLDLQLSRSRAMVSGEQVGDPVGDRSGEHGAEFQIASDGSSDVSATHSSGSSIDHSANLADDASTAVRADFSTDLSTEDLVAIDAAIADLKRGTSKLEFRSGRAIWVAVRP